MHTGLVEHPKSNEAPTDIRHLPRGLQQIGALIAGFLLLCLVLRWAWLSDDGFITSRTWDNFTNGFGLVLNRNYRVQTFTSPLFMLLGLPLYALLRDPYSTLMVLNLSCVVAMLGVTAIRFRNEPVRAAFLLLALALSPLLLSFATSGLENSLAFLIATLWVFEALRTAGKGSRLLWLCTAFLVLTRQDYVVLVAPLMMRTAYSDRRLVVRQAWPAALLVTAWLGFSIFYFGFLFPNTAYAKLNVLLDRGTLLSRGALYVLDAFMRDTVLALAFFLAAVGIGVKSLSTASRFLLLSAWAYVGYVVWIGGDFMSGRFLTTPFICVTFATEITLPRPVAELVLAAGVLALIPALRENEKARLANHWSDDSSGVIDERAAYVEHTNLIQNIVARKWRTHGYLRDYKKAARAEKSDVIVWNLIGMAAYADAPYKHVVEEMALSEPLLARLRVPANSHNRPGHYLRRIPQGYLESLRTGKNLIGNGCVRRLYDRITLAAHAPLFAPGRANAILQLNLGERTCPMP